MPIVDGNGRPRALIAAAVIVAVVVACGGAAATPVGVRPGSPSAAAGSTDSGTSAVPTTGVSGGSSPAIGADSPSPPIAGAPSSPATSGRSRVPIDLALLDILPTTVAGLPVTASTDPAGTDDPGLIDTVDRMVQAIVVDPATDAFAYVSVIALQPGVFDEGFFRSWRDSFDEGACSQAGGVGGHAETQIGGRTVYIGDCTGGVTTYHVRLDRRDAIVSVSSLGESRLGEQLVAALRP